MTGDVSGRRPAKRPTTVNALARGTGVLIDTGAFATGAWPVEERPRYSVSVKFALPVSLLALLVMGCMGWASQRWLYDSLLNEVKKNGVTAATMLAQTGRRMFLDNARFEMVGPETARLDPRRDAYLALPPDDTTPVLPANRHWLVSQGYLSERRWAELCGVDAPDAPISPAQANHARGEARLFASLLSYGASTARNEILTAYIRTPAPESRIIAASFPLGDEVQINNEDWIGDRGQSLKTLRVDGPPQAVEGVQIWTGRLLSRDSDSHEVLMFKVPILRDPSDRGPDSYLGDAVVGLRADVILQERRNLSRLQWGLTGAMLLLSGGLTVLIGRWVTRPLRVLVRDMAEVSKGRFEHQTRAASDDEIGIAARAFNLMTKRLAAAQIREREAQRIENELATASAIQKNLLPAKLPQAPGFDIAAFYRPAREVGGDYYDFFPIDDTHLGMVIADVSGKSIPGALVMSTTHTILRFLVSGNLDAADVLKKTNTVVASDIKRGMFVTAYYLIVDTASRQMLCASAGHNPLVIARADGTVEGVNPGGIALGFDKGPVFNRTIRSKLVPLHPGDRVVMYTDGVVEAKNPRDEEYGDEHFRDFVGLNRTLPSNDFMAALVRDLDQFVAGAEASDDITIVTFKVTE